MKKRISILAGLFLLTGVFAQSPEKMSYQAVIRNAANVLVVNSPVGMRFSILQGSATGAAVYVETQTPTTNINGLVTVEIGGGKISSGAFSNIDWSKGIYFIKTETDPLGGTAYSITGISQFLSVPYALYSKTSGSSLPGPKGDQGDPGPQGPQGPQGTSGSVHKVGEKFGGGIVFYVYDGGQHGLIGATQSLVGKQPWHGGAKVFTGAKASGIGAGLKNTSIILAVQASAGGNNYTPFAAKVCNEYLQKPIVQDSIYGDWYLPSYYEMDLLMKQNTLFGILKTTKYWTSTDSEPNRAIPCCGAVIGPSHGETDKDSSYSVHPIRSF